jgi:murein DD-endopeptidase MepM/ murein hydrolase activator NlpD
VRRPVVLLAAICLAVPGGAALASPCWPPPVTAPVSDPYREPPCRWCPGNRGIEYATAPGAEVRAVAAGHVAFAGEVAGTLYVVTELANGWRLTYGGLAERTVSRGDAVVAGMLLGRTAGSFHLGLRDRAAAGDDAYLDPTRYLGEWRHRPRLIPADGRAGVPAPPPALTCPAPGAAEAGRR